MPCYKPLHGWRSATRNESGKRGIVFSLSGGLADQPVSVPCGQCIGCRLERSRQWAVRCLHENSLHSSSSFITLTYNDEHIPYDHGLKKRDFQTFMKKVRNRMGPVRFYHCGEYGEDFGRPHYHALFFGLDFDDKVYWSGEGESKLYVSPALDQLWGKGYALIGNVTFESAAYVARYVTKKITGEKAHEHYQKVDPETGEVFQIEPEYTTMSRRPGIGKGWYDRYKKEVQTHDSIIVRGVPTLPPRYYDALAERDNEIELAARKEKRAKGQRQNPDNFGARLVVREEVAEAYFNLRKRGTLK